MSDHERPLLARRAVLTRTETITLRVDEAQITDEGDGHVPLLTSLPRCTVPFFVEEGTTDEEDDWSDRVRNWRHLPRNSSDWGLRSDGESL